MIAKYVKSQNQPWDHIFTFQPPPRNSIESFENLTAGTFLIYVESNILLILEKQALNLGMTIAWARSFSYHDTTTDEVMQISYKSTHFFFHHPGQLCRKK